MGNEGSGKVPATLGSDKVPRTTADADPQFGYTSWIMPQVPDRDKVAEQQFSRSPAQVPENQGSGKVPRFRKQPRGRIYAVGCTKVHATDRVPENQFSRKPRFQDHIGPVNEQSLTGGAQRDNKSARLGSANPGFQYTLWVVPRFRKRGFQEDKVPGTQGIPEIPQPILGALWRVPHMPIHVRLLSGRTASVD